MSRPSTETPGPARLCWLIFLLASYLDFPGLAGRYVALPSLEDPASPKLFSLADPHRLSAILRLAGLVEAEVQMVTEPLLAGACITKP